MNRKYPLWLKICIQLMLLACACTIIIFYWMNSSLESMKDLPLPLLFVAMLYLALQIARRQIFISNTLVDQLYYVGLAAMIAPIFLADETNTGTFNLVTDFGSFFFLIPVIIQFVRFRKNLSEIKNPGQL